MSKPILTTVFNPLKLLPSCYGYGPGIGRPERGMGPGNHFVYPTVFGLGAANGLERDDGARVSPGTSLDSDFIELSGWTRWMLCMNFTAGIPVGAATLTVKNFADPAYNNLLFNSAALPIAAGLTSFVLDSQAAALVFTPYLQFNFANADLAADVVLTASLFCFDYLTK